MALLKNIKNIFRILIDPTLFKYNSDYVTSISPNLCHKRLRNVITDDIIISLRKECLHCEGLKPECNLPPSSINIFNKINILYNKMTQLKNSNFKHKIIIVIEVDKDKYSTYDNFYNTELVNFKKLFIADYIILYGLEPHKIKVLDCSDNLNCWNYVPHYVSQYKCIIGG